MITIDFTEQVVEVQATPELVLTTGYDPSKEGETESVFLLEAEDKRTEVPVGSGARVRGTGVSNYIMRERILPGPGLYEVTGSYRRGVPRTFTINIVKNPDGMTLMVLAGSSKAHWIREDDDPVLLDGINHCFTWEQSPS